MGALEPEGSGWNPKVPVESEDSGERPKMLGWLLTHLENRSSPLHGVAELRAPEGSRVIKLPEHPGVFA